VNSDHEDHRPVSLRKRDSPMGGKQLEREIKTGRIMIAMYCRRHHGGREICEDCRKLADYAAQRVRRCPFGANKPACGKCKIHCFKPQMGLQMRNVMRFAGPKMMSRHPILAIRHLLVQRKPAPDL